MIDIYVLARRLSKAIFQNAAIVYAAVENAGVKLERNDDGDVSLHFIIIITAPYNVKRMLIFI